MNGGGTDKESKPAAAIGKNGQLTITKAAMHEFGFQAIDFRWDEKKRVFGWKKVTHIEDGEGWTKTMKMVKVNKQGQGKVGIGRILKTIGIPKENYTKLEIEKYQDTMEDTEIYYVEIPKK